MGLSDNVAVVALIVSLIALLIALGQLSQQILGTAEGYRRCSHRMTGPWVRLRWRHWVWTEFRYETHLICPELSLCPVSLQDNDTSNGYRLRSLKIKNAKKPPPKNWWLKFRRRSREDAQKAILGVFRETLGLGRKTHESEEEPQAVQNKDLAPQRSKSDPEKGKGGMCVSSSSQADSTSEEIPLLQEDNIRSWLVLLPQALKLYEVHEISEEFNKRQVPSLLRFEDQDHENERINSIMTEPHVKFREWVWDTMPNDVAKPLATTTLGFITVFALRMGMTWRSTDLTKGQLLADGNGCIISFTEISGLGLVAKFHSPSNFSNFPPFIPGQAADKLMCGVILGAKDLVDEEFPCIRDDRQEETMSAICDKIDVNRDLFNLWTKARFAETQNDAIAFLCEYLPMRGYSAFKYRFWGWTDGAHCILKNYEGRFALWEYLRKQNLTQVGKSATTLSKVFHYMDILRSRYEDEFYNMRKTAASAAGGQEDGWKKKQGNLQEDCLAIFNWTTTWFTEKGFCKRVGNESSSRTLYMALVAAHCRMSVYASHDGINTVVKIRDKNPKWIELKQDKYEKPARKAGVPPECALFNAMRYEIGRAYIRHAEDEDHGIWNYMRDVYSRWDEGTINDAWWVMMLRGVAWSMPVVLEQSGEAVPSSFDNNGTPVWIT